MNAQATQNATLPASHSVSHNPLPSSWIAKIFEEMSAMYGSKFADLWAGSNMEAVQRKWADKLGGFRDIPGAIREALDALDSKPWPPTLPEFLALCREAGHGHSAPVQAIGHTPTAEEQARAAEIIAKAAERMTKTDTRDHKLWAKRLKERHEAGEAISITQRNAYMEALA